MLELGSNKIKEIENLEGVSSIRSLFLGKNRISEIKNLEALVNLEQIALGVHLSNLAKQAHLNWSRSTALATHSARTLPPVKPDNSNWKCEWSLEAVDLGHQLQRSGTFGEYWQIGASRMSIPECQQDKRVSGAPITEGQCQTLHNFSLRQWYHQGTWLPHEARLAASRNRWHRWHSHENLIQDRFWLQQISGESEGQARMMQTSTLICRYVGMRLIF